MKSYRELSVWKRSMELVVEVYRLIKLLPKEEMYALSDQMRRAAVSIPSNIAEGYSRNSDKELAQFLYIARGSKSELETQLLITVSLGYVSDAQVQTALAQCEEVGKMLNAFLKKIVAVSR